MAHDDWDKREFEVANAKLLEGSMVFEATGERKRKVCLLSDLWQMEKSLKILFEVEA